jgi:glycerol-3-phosphate dehydrogenase
MRDIEGLASRRYDLLVIGGGIHGLFAAYDAAQRGLSVALVERADFGSGLSFNHQRTLHGGLRELGRVRLGKARQQIRERRAWARIAPHLLRPLPFLIGTYRWTSRSRMAFRMGFSAYDALGRSRNLDVSPELHLPKARLESPAATRRLFPGIKTQGLTGGAVWYDYQMKHPDRLAWTVALAAEHAGARLANYVEAIAALKSSGRATGARVRDLVSGREHDIEAAVTLLAPGSRLASVMALYGVTGAPPVVRAMNLLLDRSARDIAVGAPAPSGRLLTCVPWRGFVLVGTHQSDRPVAASDERVPAEAIQACLADLHATFPGIAAEAKDVRMVHHGLVAARVAKGGAADLLPDPLVIRHGRDGLAGLVSLVGVKFTTARLSAERAVDAAVRELRRPARRCRTAVTGLPHAGIADVEGRLIETLRGLALSLDRDIIEHLTGWYGTEAPDVVSFAAGHQLLDRVLPGSPVLSGEMAYAVDRSHAIHLTDAILRRTALGSTGHPGPQAVARAAVVMGARLGWSPRERTAEILAVEQFYESAGGSPGGAGHAIESRTP